MLVQSKKGMKLDEWTEYEFMYACVFVIVIVIS